MRGPHDLGGLAAGPVDASPHDMTYWEKQIDAINMLLAQWVGELKSGRNIQAFDDHRFCPITLDNALDTIAALIEGGGSGIYQVSGSADISFAEAARHLAARIGMSPLQVTAVKAGESGVPPDEITPFTSLDASRLSSLTGYVPPRPYTVIDKVFAASLSPACAQ